VRLNQPNYGAELQSTAAPCYVQVQKMRFHFKALNRLRLISLTALPLMQNGCWPIKGDGKNGEHSIVWVVEECRGTMHNDGTDELVTPQE
jgi:hypothetical protein